MNTARPPWSHSSIASVLQLHPQRFICRHQQQHHQHQQHHRLLHHHHYHFQQQPTRIIIKHASSHLHPSFVRLLSTVRVASSPSSSLPPLSADATLNTETQSNSQHQQPETSSSSSSFWLQLLTWLSLLPILYAVDAGVCGTVPGQKIYYYQSVCISVSHLPCTLSLSLYLCSALIFDIC